MERFLSLVDSKLEKGSSQTGHDDEDLFKERLKNMGKRKQWIGRRSLKLKATYT